MLAYGFVDDAEEGDVYRAGSVAPAGIYSRMDAPLDKLIELASGDTLPASCDGHVACYRRVGLTGAMLLNNLQGLQA